MPRPVKDLTGQRFGTLEVHSRAGSNEHGKATWWVHCFCGEGPIEVVGNNLTSGNTRTCSRTCDLRGMEEQFRSDFDF